MDAETLKHFQAIIKMDSTDPPGNEKPVADYLKQVLEAEGIPVQVFSKEAHRPNIVARLKGSGKQKPLLLMAHTDTVNVDPKKWTHPPFSAAQDAGYIYGRGTVDDKDNVVSTLMVMLTLKRLNVPLDRDVIALFEAGEEGSSSLGIQFVANEHFDAIDSEFCFAEGGGVTRTGGAVKFASVQTVEKIPRAITVTARGVAGHGSVPLENNALAHLGEAVGKIAAWTPPMRINETTAALLQAARDGVVAEEAKRYQALLSPDPKVSGPANDYMRKNEPRHWSMLRTSLSPTMIDRRLPHQRHPVGRHRDHRHPPGAGRGSGEVPRAGQAGRQRSERRSELRRARHASVDADREARLGCVQGARSQHHQALQGDHAADDEHRCDRHGVPAPQGHPVLRHRPGHRQRGWPEGLRRAQRSGAHPRKRAVSIRALQLGRGARRRSREIGRRRHRKRRLAVSGNTPW